MAIEISPEETDKYINKTAEYVHKYGLNMVAILMIEAAKPLSYIGGQLGRVFLSPFLPAFGEGIELGGEKFLIIFEQRENVDKLLKRIEELNNEEEEREKERKAQEKTRREKAGEKAPKKKGWRRFLSF